MDSNADILKKSMQKKKKKLAQGEMSKYDPDKAKAAEDKASSDVLRDRMKKMKKGY